MGDLKPGMGRRIAAQDEFRIVEVDPSVFESRRPDGAYRAAIQRMVREAGDKGKSFEFLPPAGRVMKSQTLVRCLGDKIRKMGLSGRVHAMKRGMHVYVKVDPVEASK